jgi:hypothetical protein
MFTYTWKKYIPVIKILMKRSMEADQMLQINRIDFEKATRSRKNACSFSIELKKGRLVPIGTLGAGKDLADVLQEDDGIKALLANNIFSFSFNSSFELSIKYIAEIKEDQAEPTGLVSA